MGPLRRRGPEESFDDVICYTFDVPHYEGGKRPIENLVESLKRAERRGSAQILHHQ